MNVRSPAKVQAVKGQGPQVSETAELAAPSVQCLKHLLPVLAAAKNAQDIKVIVADPVDHQMRTGGVNSARSRAIPGMAHSRSNTAASPSM